MPDRPAALAPPRWLALRWLVVTVTGAGLIAMHTLMGVGGGHCAGGAPMSGAVTLPGAGSTFGAAPMTGVITTAAAALITDAVTPTAQAITAQGTSGHHRHHGDGSMAMVAHLCLVVLGLLLLALAAQALLGWFRRAPARAAQLAGHPAGSGQPRAPPPTNVRLAQLCISRR